jgi:hypothetical protein
MRTKKIYFSSLPINIEILKVSLDWVLTTVVPMRLQHAAMRGVMRRNTLRTKMRTRMPKINAQTGSVSKSNALSGGSV